MPFQDYGYKPSGITRPKARPKPKATSSSYYSGNEFGSGNIFTETSPGASTVNFGNNNNNNNNNDNNSYQAPSLVQAPVPTVTAPAAPTPAQIEAERQDRIARVFEAAGATLPEDKGRMGRVGRGIDLYSRDIFTTPYVATPDNTQEITDYLQRTAVDDALRDALGMPEVYQGIPTQEEPEPNIDMSVLQEALMPEPITVEELPDGRGGLMGSPTLGTIAPDAGVMNFSDRSALTNMDNLQLVDIEDETGSAGLMTRPKARPEGLRALSEPEKNKAAQKYLGITADGIWGKGSTRKLAGWQYQNGVPVSGVLDEATIKAMENPETEDPRKEITRKSVLNTAGTAPDISKVKDWAKENIKDPMRAAAFVATVEAETGGRALVESGHTLKSAVRTFVTNNKYMHEGNDVRRPLTAKGKRRKQKLEALGSNATGDEIFDFIYGPDTDAIGGNLGNTSATDGSKYKGRGLVQITGKDNYQRVGDIIGVDLVNNPELVKDPKYAAAAAMAYLTLPGKDFFDGTLTSDKLASAIGHTGSAATRWSRATALKNEMYP